MASKNENDTGQNLGSAKEGTHHWWAQRVTAIALIPLSVWFVASLVFMTGASYGEAAAWLGFPFNALLVLLLLVFTFYHAVLGLQVVVEDYVHGEGKKIALLLLIKGAAIFLCAGASLAVLALLFR